ncbi:MAG: hypothetical protein COA36_05925 [Desulfotalea sp.]|nr:MAG: hypothetical protein COA36_05925 [Desulfotalea sp.]
MPSPLENDHIDIWLLPIEGWNFTNLEGRQLNQLLSEKEQCRFQRFRPPRKKTEFIASRLLLRHLLSTYTECDVLNTEAVPDGMGRPFWFENNRATDLFFSLSHTKNMVCCALSRHQEIGCDIESLQPRKYLQELAERVFSEQEHNYYQQLPLQSQSEFFYRSWTLKEAFIKALGQGLRIPLTSLSFTYMAHLGKTFVVSPKQLGSNWTSRPYFFQSCQPTPGYSLGIATPIKAASINIIDAQLTTGNSIRAMKRADSQSHNLPS